MLTVAIDPRANGMWSGKKWTTNQGKKTMAHCAGKEAARVVDEKLFWETRPGSHLPCKTLDFSPLPCNPHPSNEPCLGRFTTQLQNA